MEVRFWPGDLVIVIDFWEAITALVRIFIKKKQKQLTTKLA